MFCKYCGTKVPDKLKIGEMLYHYRTKECLKAQQALWGLYISSL